MARVLLIGCGPLPGPGVRRSGFPQHRLASTASALQVAGHTLRVVCLVRADELGEERRDGDWAGLFPVVEEGPGWVEKIADLARGAEVIVSMGPYTPGRAAALVAGDRHFWADVPGDPFAELEAVLQAHARGHGEMADLDARVAAAQAAALLVLERADAIGVISEAQRLATLGQLGLAGRLVDPVPVERVFVMPVAMDFGVSAPPRPRRPGELVVAVSGGLNTWFDEDSLMAGLDLAFARLPGLRLVLTGGALPGHHTAAARRVAAWAERHTGRVMAHGWLPEEAMVRALAAAHLGLNLDRSQNEATLGSRTRLLFYAALGMEIATTTASPLGRELVDEGLALGLAMADPAGLADRLVALAAQGCPGASRTQEVLRRRYDPVVVAAPLLRWLESPSRAPAAKLPSATLARELAEARAALAAVHATPTWRAMAKIQGWFKRRGLA